MKHPLIGVLFLTSCAATQPQLASAVIRFAEEPPMGLPGEIVSVDGIDSPDRPTSVIFLAGKRTVVYRCPDTVTLDRLPSVEIDLEPGRIHELVCNGGAATVRVK